MCAALLAEDTHLLQGLFSALGRLARRVAHRTSEMGDNEL